MVRIIPEKVPAMSDSSLNPASDEGPKRLSQTEFVAMLISLMGMVAFAIDSMLPSLPEIARELTPENVNRAQLVVTVFMLGMGVGTFFSGAISDAIGRKATIAGGALIYILGALLAGISDDLTTLLLGRCLQGVGASGARTVPMALIRDLYAGPKMAKIFSVIMMFFILIPAFAPTIGGWIAAVTGWRGLFVVFACVAIVSGSWVLLRQPETLKPENRRPFAVRPLLAGAREVLANRNVRIFTLVLVLGFGQMFALLSSSEQLYTIFDVHETYPYWFGASAILAGTASAFNAKFVERIGMFRIARGAFLMQVVVSAIVGLLSLGGIGTGMAGLIMMFIWNGSIVAIAGASFGNINAMAMHPMGHLAGMAASVLTAFSTVGAVAIAIPVGLAFNGTVYPLVTATLICSGLAWVLMGMTKRDLVSA